MTFPSLLWGGGGRMISAGFTPGTPVFATATAAGTAHTKGAWAELSASIGVDASFVTVLCYGTVASRRYLLDIGVGGAGSEQVLISNIGFTVPPSFGVNTMEPLLLPISIPNGTRVSARVQSSTASAPLRVCVLLHQAPLDMTPGLQRCVNYGALTGSTEGTSVDPGGVADTKGSWVQMTSACTYPVRAIVLNTFDLNSLPTGTSWQTDIAVGSGGSEQIVVGDIIHRVNTASSSTVARPIYTPPFPVDIPAGTRLSVRSKCQITDATDRLQRVALICVD